MIYGPISGSSTRFSTGKYDTRQIIFENKIRKDSEEVNVKQVDTNVKQETGSEYFFKNDYNFNISNFI